MLEILSELNESDFVVVVIIFSNIFLLFYFLYKKRVSVIWTSAYDHLN